jgi:hypothetical protein
LPTFDIWMPNILQFFLATSNYSRSMLLTSVKYSSKKRLIYVTLNWRRALNVSGYIKYLNKNTKLYHKHLWLYDWHHKHGMVMLEMNVSQTDITMCIFYTIGRSYNDEQYLPCLWREENHKTSKRTMLQAGQLYTKCNRRLAFSLKIY